MAGQAHPQYRSSTFGHWLRTGFWLPEQVADPTLEVKFNPYHDPRNGQFTFAPGGGVGGAGMTRPPRLPQQQPGREDPRFRADDERRRQRDQAADPRNPTNYTLYKVQPGDTLTKIAASRNRLTPADLLWLNGMSGDRLRIGQELRLPKQEFLDAGKRDFDTYVALRTYMQSHGGRLPPDPAHPPSLVEQMYGTGSKAVAKNGYTFNLDPSRRPRGIYGELSDAETAPRSKANQGRAGGADRLRDDDGGHFIAARFNGPGDAFNHFAQNRNFNRGRYRSMEEQWAKDLKAGKRVSVSITPLYQGVSKRPDSLIVFWTVDGHEKRESFRNEPTGSKMTTDKFDELGPAFAEIGREAVRLAGGEPNGIFLYVEAGDNWVGISLYKDEGSTLKYIRIGDSMNLDNLLMNAWFLEPADKRWTSMQYMIDHGKFAAEFDFDDLKEPNEDGEDRRERIIRARFGKKQVIYPPFSPHAWTLEPPA